MHQLCESVTGWRKRQWLNTVITHAYELSDAKLVKQFAKSVPANDRGEVLGFDLLGKIGMKQDAIAAATAELKSSLSMLNNDRPEYPHADSKHHESAAMPNQY